MSKKRATQAVADDDELTFGTVVDGVPGVERLALAKAHVVTVDAGTNSNIVAAGEDIATSGIASIFKKARCLEPPYNPDSLAKVLENSSALRQNIDSYITNIDAFGHRLEPVLDLNSNDAFERVRTSIYLERVYAEGEKNAVLPDDKEVEAATKEIEAAMRVEKFRVENFFEFCNFSESFTAIRRKLRFDVETFGNGFMEVVRNAKGEIAQLNHIQAFTMRLLPQDAEVTQAQMKLRVSDFQYIEVPVPKAFRRFAQVVGDRLVYFREMGDKRVLSGKTGEYFENIEAMNARPKDEGHFPATEVVHFKVHNPRGPYGIPRWIGVLLPIMGSRQAEEINYLYFDNKSIPAMAVLVSGGRLTQDSTTKIRDYIKQHIKGKGNFHSILVIEAEDGSTSQATTSAPVQTGKMKIELKPLTHYHQQDALFQQYDERNMDKVGMAFRLPRILRGDVRDFNRATADAALLVAEMQVFGPEREEFDFEINRKLLTDMGIRYWKFQSNAPTTRDPAALAAVAAKFVESGALTIEESRVVASDALGRELRKIDAPWAKLPLKLLTHSVLTGDGDVPSTGETPSTPTAGGDGSNDDGTSVLPGVPAATPVLNKAAETLIGLRDALLRSEGAEAERRYRVALNDDGDTVLKIPAEDMAKLLEPQ